MGLIWIAGMTLCWVALAYSVPVEIIYAGDGCECPTKLGYQVNVPKLPKPRSYTPYNYGYKIDVPPVPIKAKVSYTFDFSVEEPRPPRPEKQDRLKLYAKIDRITLNKPDCPEEYTPHPPSCNCGQCGGSKPIYRYVNRKLSPCKCRHPKCNCNLRGRTVNVNSQTTVGTPVVVASGRLPRSGNNIRRKRDLQRLFFRPRRQQLQRMPRYVKMYHKNLPEQGDGWFNLDFDFDLTNPNPFKRKTKKAIFPHIRSKIVKRDIKAEYDLLEKESELLDLTLPEIIQFMPETLQPNFKRGQCQFGCAKSGFEEPLTSEGNGIDETEADNQTDNVSETIKPNDSTTKTIKPSAKNNHEESSNKNTNNNNNNKNNFGTFTKRNAADYNYQNLVSSYEAAASPIAHVNSASYTEHQNDYAADTAQPTAELNPTNPVYGAVEPAMLSPCEQRKVYASMRQATESAYTNNNKQHSKAQQNDEQLRYVVSTAGAVPDPYNQHAPPLQYAGDLEVPHFHYVDNAELQPIVGAPQHPVQHVSSELLDRIISDIIYRHPEFIEASSHYGGALVDPEPYQEQETKDFIKKLLDGRFGVLFDDSENEYTRYHSASHYGSQLYNPFNRSPAYTPYPMIY